MSEEVPQDLIETIKRQQVETKLRLSLANRHINTLYSQVQDLEEQFRTAMIFKKHSARYNLRQKLAVVMGLKIVYLNYCSVKSQELKRINRRLRTLTDRDDEAMDTDALEEPSTSLAEM